MNDTTREIGGTLGVAVLGSIVASYYATTMSPLLDRIPAALMNDDEKGFARATVLSVLEIRKREIPPFLEQQRENLILTMKTTVLQARTLRRSSPRAPWWSARSSSRSSCPGHRLARTP